MKNKLYGENLALLNEYSNSSSLNSPDSSRMMVRLSTKNDSTILEIIKNFSSSEEQLLVLTGFTWE